MAKANGFASNLAYLWLEKRKRKALLAQKLVEVIDDYGFDFVDQVLDRFGVEYFASQNSRRNIPSHGKVIFVANHPAGNLDCLALLSFVNEIRQDVCLVSFDLLADIPQLAPHVIAVGKGLVAEKRADVRRIIDALNQEKALIIFPAIKRAGSVKKMQVRDKKWHQRYLKLALHADAPILPIHIRSKTKRMPIFQIKKHSASHAGHLHTLYLSVGEMISSDVLKESKLTFKKCSQLVQRHLYRVAKGYSGVFDTKKTISHPENPLKIREELKQAESLGETMDGKKIFLFDYMPNSAAMREIGRLREYTFRNVGEGTGRVADLDRYDRYYRHIILWSDAELEIVGAYRLAEANHVVRNIGLKGLYCQELFELGRGFDTLLPNAIELGRSFVQPKYWGKRSLDYLWYGIGAYLKRNPQIQLLYGPVSISAVYPEAVKKALVNFYRKQFQPQKQLAFARKPFSFCEDGNDIQFSTISYEDEFRKLKEYLQFFDVKVPTLYKQYGELCEPGGVVFEDFSVDSNFGDCIDGLVRVDLRKIKMKKRMRYIGETD